MRDVYLITYDIRHPERLKKLAKIAQDYGLRRQESVFEAKMTPFELQKMENRMQRVISLEEDSIKIFKMCSTCAGKKIELGCSPTPADSEWCIL